MTSKRSNVYRRYESDSHTTPSGSNVNTTWFFYKHAIPSGLCFVKE